MNIKELEEILLKTSSSLMRIKGEEIFNKRLADKIKGKNIEGIYNIYGQVLNPINNEEIKTHIKIDLKKKKLNSVRCSCENFKEISINKKLFMCQHLTATAYSFLHSFYKNNKEGNRESKRIEGSNKKQQVTIHMNVIHRFLKGHHNYEVEFRLGAKHKYLISDLRSFILALKNKENIFLNHSFTYNPLDYDISEEDKKIIELISKYINRKEYISSGKSLIVSSRELKEFLYYTKEEKIKFKYNDIEYTPSIYKKDLPLNFTLKVQGDSFVLTTHKKLPISLSEEGDIYLFNDELYLPSKNQISKYSLLYDKFKKKDKILYNKTVENYNKLTCLLKSISSNITYSEEVKAFGEELFKLEFLLYKDRGNIYCNVEKTYNNEKINILDNNYNSIKEEKILMTLEGYKFIRVENRLKFIGGDEELFNILTKKKEGLYSLGKVILGEGFKNINIYNSSYINLDFYEDNMGFKMCYTIGDIKERELNSAFESYKQGNKFYKTRNGIFIDFNDEGIKEFFNLIQVLITNKSMEEGSIEVDKNKTLYILEALKDRSFNIGKGIDLLKHIEEKIISMNNEDILVPKGLKGNLRPYQVEGFRWFKTISNLGFGGVLADDMGLGKTIQTIAFLTSEKDKKSLIVTPTSLIYNWKEEIERFSESLKVKIIHGSDKDIKKSLEEADVILTTYGTLRNNIETYKDIKFNYCIIDEAQNIKNPKAQSTISLKRINAEMRFALTGTPMENNLMELWSIFDFIMPGYLYSKEDFEKEVIYNQDKGIKLLRDLIKPFILRRTKGEVLEDLKEKRERKVLVEMTDTQKAIYSSYIKEVREKIKENTNDRIEVFSYLTKLRQICLDPTLVIEDYKGGSGKVHIAMELLEEHISNNKKILLFSQFTSVLGNLGKFLEEKNIEYFYLDGATESKDRVRLVKDFNKGNKVKVFLISLKAGGTGLNLTSANTVIHFDPWWNPAVEDQATDRAHRIGQKNIVEVIKLIAKGTIEESIIRLQEDKKNLIQSIINEELKNSDAFNKLSKEDLLNLFNRD
ncbi:DEAD/DEAH box helicase [Clostridium hydrogeniformans]|uniref:DEAD/DEAH box helicase n=1 Tax=Clostridium hydrogeniformans TaxID=349933 RepID=UPI00048541CB|nr:SNF2-related protein [Clostridium hydrogeniformans]